jgi:diaminopimelate decarboxylase
MAYKKTNAVISLFPDTAAVDNKNNLVIGGCKCTDLAKEFGTPLYVFDEQTIRSRCREFKEQFTRLYPDTLIAYASKAFLNRAIAAIIKEEKLCLDTVSGGEISVAASVKFPMKNIYFHGNNKLKDELEFALHHNLGRIVVDNFYELEILNGIARSMKKKQDILLRLNPGIDAHTHSHTTTGILDSKFGFPVATGQAEQAIARAASMSNLNLIGIHCHLGSPIFETAPYELAVDALINFAASMLAKYKFQLSEFSTGGGFAVPYTRDVKAPAVAEYASAITGKLAAAVKKAKIKKPRLIMEPGRSIIAKSGVALYTVGAIKDIPGVRTYVCIDGGMGDNIRPALYDSKYEAVAANNVGGKGSKKVTIAGKYCESGDKLIKDIDLPELKSGDVIAMPVSGAYSIPMSSNYNMVPRPAVVLVNKGNARIIRKRETYRDLIKLDIL